MGKNFGIVLIIFIVVTSLENLCFGVTLGDFGLGRPSTGSLLAPPAGLCRPSLGL